MAFRAHLAISSGWSSLLGWSPRLHGAMVEAFIDLLDVIHDRAPVLHENRFLEYSPALPCPDRHRMHAQMRGECLVSIDCSPSHDLMFVDVSFLLWLRQPRRLQPCPKVLKSTRDVPDFRSPLRASRAAFVHVRRRSPDSIGACFFTFFFTQLGVSGAVSHMRL